MAEPLTKKIDALPEMDAIAASNDKLLMLDVSESAVNMTKLVPMKYLSIHTASQLAANVVTTAGIANGAVTNSKLGADAVTSAKIADNAIGNEHIRDSEALSVIGRSSNTSGNPADIVAGTDGYVLRRSGTTLGFGTVATAGIADGAVTEAKIGTGAVTPTKTNFFGGSAIYFGCVAANGTAISLPSGWSVSRSAVGNYRVTHPSFPLNFPVVSAQYMSTVNAVATYFDVNTMNAQEFRDAAFWFVLIVG